MPLQVWHSSLRAGLGVQLKTSGSPASIEVMTDKPANSGVQPAGAQPTEALPGLRGKLASRADVLQRVQALPRPLVFTNGVFDVLHRGHVNYLHQAAALGGSLIVAVNSDASARLLGKGPDRPLNRAEDRATVLAKGC